MKKYVKATFAVEDPNQLLAENLPSGEPGLVGIIFDKESSVQDVTSEMNILGWNMPRLFTIMVISQNIIKFGGLFLAIAGLFILIGLKLAAPVLSAFGFDEKFANQIFYPFCWGVATFSLAFPIVKEVTLYVAYGIGLIGLSIYNGETAFTLDPQASDLTIDLAALRQALDQAEAKIFEITSAREHRSFVPLKDVVKEAFKRIEKLYERFPILREDNRDVSDHALEKRGVLNRELDASRGTSHTPRRRSDAPDPAHRHGATRAG